MVRASVLRRFTIPPICVIFLSVAGGCGGSSTYEGVEQQSTANQSQARAAAYGNSGNPAAKAKAGKPALSAEAQARGRGGR